MFEASLSGISGFLERDSARHMTDQRKAETLRLLRNGEVGVPRRPVVNLDKIDTAFLEHAHGVARVFGRRDAESKRPIGGSVVKNRTRKDDLRTDYHARRRGSAQAKNEVELGTHVPSTRNAVRHVQWEQGFSSPLVVGVHVPEARNKELATTVHDAHTPWDRGATGDRRDESVSNRQRGVCRCTARRWIDDRDAIDSECI